MGQQYNENIDKGVKFNDEKQTNNWCAPTTKQSSVRFDDAINDKNLNSKWWDRWQKPSVEWWEHDEWW